jgi:CheY-like chemotaxis protein
MAERLLLIEDDATLAELVRDYLGPLGFDIVSAGTAVEGLRRLKSENFDAVLLDVMLPDLDGFEVCRRVRSFSDLPVLMLTARGDDEDRIAGLEIGADDYLPKPFNPRELLARIRAVLRRRRPSSRVSAPVRFGRLEIDRDARVVRVDGEVSPAAWERGDRSGLRAGARPRPADRARPWRRGALPAARGWGHRVRGGAACRPGPERPGSRGRMKGFGRRLSLEWRTARSCSGCPGWWP